MTENFLTTIYNTLVSLSFLQTKGSQLVPDSWKALDPETMQSIEDDEGKGDFLAIVERRGLDAELSQVFQRHWNHLQVNGLIGQDNNMNSE